MLLIGGLSYKALNDIRSVTFGNIEQNQNHFLATSHLDMRLARIHSDLYRTLNVISMASSEELMQKGVDDILKRLAELNTDIKKAFPEAEDLHQALASYSDKVSQTLDMATIEITAAAMLIEDAAETFDSTSQLMVDRLNKSSDLVEAAIGGGKERIGDILSFYTILLLVAAILSIFVALFIANLIRRQISDMADGITSAEQGDLTTRITVSSTDELGQTAAVFNNFLEAQQSLIGHIHDSVKKVASAATILSKTTDENNEMIDEQRTATSMVATAITQMTAAVQDVSRNTRDAADAANAANKHAKNGNQVVMSTITAIEALANDVESATQVTQELENASEKIGSVLVVIKSIAEQTNLLALNAAIEAARAGEKGRGFAVVADEVRSLASRTQESTQEIENMIESLQSKAKVTVVTMQSGQQKAMKTKDQTGAAGDSLGLITNAMSSITEMNIQIAATAEEQSQVTEEINRNVVRINEIAGKNSESAKHTSDASTQLASLAEDLSNKVSHFKIS